MSLELHSSEANALTAMWKAWENSQINTEIEASFKSIDYATFLTIIKHLRSMGLVEEPQETKLNILVEGGLRFTIVGDAVIRAYCRDNSLKGKPFHAILKEKKYATHDGLNEVDFNEYDARVKIRREMPLDSMNHRVLQALSKWSTIPKAFRYMRRFQFKSTTHSGIVFDISLVRENKKDNRGSYIRTTNFQSANIMSQPLHYEVEVEAKENASMKSMLIGIATILRGIQRSYILVRKSIKDQILTLLASQTGARSGFPGSQPTSLKKENIALEQISGTPNIRYGDYNVTDKADGLRCLMVVGRDGRIYMVDRNLNVYGTGRRLGDAETDEWAGAVLDGEWVTQDAKSAPMSRYYAFDIYNGRRGEDVTNRPFIVRTPAPTISRLVALTETVAALDNAPYFVSNIPTHHKLSVHVKHFRTSPDPADPTGIFKEAGILLEKIKHDAPYHTDGLIFSPNEGPLPKNIRTWRSQFKWKPASMNSVDFLVVIEKERDMDNKPTNVEYISTQLREDTGQMTRSKTLRLFVGSSMHTALEKPRDTVLYDKPLPKQNELHSVYRPMEFSPQPYDPFASVCHVAINAGATDAAGAAPESQLLESLDDTIYCEETRDPIADKCIVEMAYDPKRPVGWRWIPMRVRWDKTELFHRQKTISGTANDESTANDVWNSIHDPITEHMISTGAVTEETIESGITTGTVSYYQRKAPQIDLYKIRGLADFHNQYIKKMLLHHGLSNKGSALLDLSVGQAGDIHKWVELEADWVLGCDIAESGLTDNVNGAYRRYLNYLIKGQNPLPQMIFVQADSSARLMDGSAGQTPEDRGILRTLWGESDTIAPPAAHRLTGKAAIGFDAASLMFSLHYFFKDRETLDGLLRNLSESVKVGGLFIGCCFDGNAVASLLRDLPLGGTKRGTENSTDIWTITKQYDDSTGTIPSTEEGLGLAIDVNFISIGKPYKEYLVNFTYFTQRMKEIGFELLSESEQTSMGLYNSTALFSESYAIAQKRGLNYPMSPVVQTFSFLNRWFIFRRQNTTMLPSSSPIVLRMPTPAAVAASISAKAENAPAITDEVPIVENNTSIDANDTEIPAGTDIAESYIIAEGPTFVFNNRAAAAKKEELKLLEIEDKHWRRYISTYTPFEFKDRVDPSIHYSSFEAAYGSAKYQLATNKPELGPQIFSITGNIHQETENAKLRASELSEEDVLQLLEKEVVHMRDASKPTAIRKAGAKFNAEIWETERERVIIDYVRQRMEGDPKFRAILTSIANQKGRLVYKVADRELGESVKRDGTIDGDNLYGKALMRAVGLRY